MRAAREMMSRTSIAISLLILFAAATSFAAPGDPDPGNPDPGADKYARTSSSVSTRSPSWVIPRFWVGLSGNYTPFRMVKGTEVTDSTTGNDTISSPANGQVGGGINFNVRLFGNYWINIGGVYRFAGYDTNAYINDVNGTTYIERTRARYLDFPVLFRYAGPHLRWNRHSFWEAGGTLRYATSIKMNEAASNVNGYFCCAPASTTTVKRQIEGVTVGTGLVGKDDFGIKVAPEVRYTRWMGNTFSSSTVATPRDQLEVAISFGF
jgi:hypothetical protein